MKILAIETSCDETAIAVVKAEKFRFKILSNIISSQVKLHAKYGGVYPSLAKREHIKNLPIVFKKAIKKAIKKARNAEIDLIGVTVGHGLEPCLWQGVNFAKDLSKKFKVPIVPVNHIEAHILSNWLERKNISMPAVCLVVSGGHTGLILMKGIGKYKLIGETRDDAAGECFDKTARILGLGYPGGPAVAAEAAKFDGGQSSVKLPRPMIEQKNYDFSFSGLKTAVLYKVKEGNYDRIEMCAEVQQAIIDVLLRKTIKAAKNYKAKSIILGGGVAANHELRKQFKEKLEKEIPNSKFYIPAPKFCTDNAVMVAAAAYFHKSQSKKLKDIKADANLKI